MDPYITKAIRLIEETTNGLDESILCASPNGRWSPAQVLEHLDKAYSGTANVLEQSVARGKIIPMRPLTLRDRLGIALVVGIGFLPEGRKAPAPTIPSESPSGLETCRQAITDLERLGKALIECEQKWGSSTHVFPHPIIGPLTVPQLAKFHFVHTRHHMKQVRERAQLNRVRAASAS